jgi:hypothetical protein
MAIRRHAQRDAAPGLGRSLALTVVQPLGAELRGLHRQAVAVPLGSSNPPRADSIPDSRFLSPSAVWFLLLEGVHDNCPLRARRDTPSWLDLGRARPLRDSSVPSPLATDLMRRSPASVSFLYQHNTCGVIQRGTSRAVLLQY